MKKYYLLLIVGILGLLITGFSATCADDTDGPRFTGVFSDSGIDANGDGFYDQLMVSAEVEVDTTSDCAVSGLLYTLDHRLISCKPYMNIYTFFSETSSICDSGKTTFEVVFSGEDIRDHKIDGPFIAALELSCQDSGAKTKYETSAYSYAAFRESPAGILHLISDRGVDTTGDGLFDYLEVQVSIEVIRSGDYEYYGMIVADTIRVAGAPFFVRNCKPGIDSVTATIDGHEIRKARLDGPYQLEVSLNEFDGSQVNIKTFETGAYTHTQFSSE